MRQSALNSGIFRFREQRNRRDIQTVLGVIVLGMAALGSSPSPADATVLVRANAFADNGGFDPNSGCTSPNPGFAAIETCSANVRGASASSRADLVLGELGAYAFAAQTVPHESQGSGTSELRDTITITGDLSHGLSGIITLHVEGTLTPYVSNSSPRAPTAYAYASLFATSLLFDAGGQHNFQNTGCADGDPTCTNGTVFDDMLTVPFQVTANRPTVALDINLGAGASAFSTYPTSGGTADFGHTGTLDINLPAGYGFTSESGLLLTGRAAIGVPEPSSLTMFGLVVMGLLLRRMKLNEGVQ